MNDGDRIKAGDLVVAFNMLGILIHEPKCFISDYYTILWFHDRNFGLITEQEIRDVVGKFCDCL